MSFFKLFFSALVLAGCSQIKQDVLVASIDDYQWSDNVSFVFNNNDSLSKRDVMFILRHDNTFEYDNVKVLFSVTSPRGDSFSDTLTFNMKQNSNDTNLSFVTNFEHPIIENAVFDTCATYYFNIKPLMKEPLKGVLNVGLAL